MYEKKRNINLSNVLFKSIELTRDGVAIFDDKDNIIFCNQSFKGIFSIAEDSSVDHTFSSIITHCFDKKVGMNIETTDVNQWLQSASVKRRSQPYRTFETDSLDGKWYLVTEQLLDDNYLYVYFTNITASKMIENKLMELTRQLTDQSQKDSLTGIYNHGYFYQLAEQELQNSQSNGGLFSLVLFDLDYFKRINDNFGHLVGDKILVQFVNLIQSQIRSDDVFSRVGGEEFALLLKNVTCQQAFSIVEKLRESLLTLSINEQLQLITVTISIGVVDNSSKPKSVEEMIDMADKGLYKAKSLGRNRTVLYQVNDQLIKLDKAL